MDPGASFGAWLEKRRKALDLTREEVAQRAGCSVSALRKIETDERRPSKQLASLLADCLEIPPEDRLSFLKIARGEQSLGQTRSPASLPTPPPIPEPPSPRPRTQLPSPPTPLVGREQELRALGQLLTDPQCRIITLVGPGGIGKTRLAIQAAADHCPKFREGAFYAGLSGLSNLDHVIPAIAEALQFFFYGALEPKIQLFNYLHEKELLLVLDNFEQLIQGAWLVVEITEKSPGVKLLITSREQLNVRGEWTFEVDGLSYPNLPSVDSRRFSQPFEEHPGNRPIEDYSAVALFIQSARRASVGYKIEAEDYPAIVQISSLVEGIPLGLELAATWVRTLTCAEIAREIEGSLDFLSTPGSGVLQRHKSMRAVFDHSWNLLTEEEQRVIGRLSVFRGEFTRQAAEQIAGASLPILSGLIAKSFLRRQSTGRYDLHELLHQYSAAHLAADPQAHAAAQQRHYDFFLSLLETADQELKGNRQLDWLSRLEQDYGNLWAAFEWALESDRVAPGSDELALRLSGALRWFWRMRGDFHEGRAWLKEALQLSPERPTAARAGALLGMSLLMNGLGDLGAARQPAEESAVIYRELGNLPGLAEALTVDGLTLVWQGEATLGRARLEEALTTYRKAGDRWGEAQVLYRLGSFLADYSGDITGRVMLEESAAILENLGEKYLFLSVLISLGIVKMGLGDYAAARTLLERGLIVAREIKHPWGIADALTNLGCVFRIRGEYTSAQSYLEEALEVYQRYGRSIWETDVLCALAENAIAQGNFSTARLHLQAAFILLETSENKWLQALVWYFRGFLAYYEGDAEEAAVLLGEATALARKGQFKPDLARSLVALGRVKRLLGEVILGSKLLLEGLDLFRKLGNKLGIAIAIDELAAVSALQGEGVQAVMLLSTTHALREVMGAPLPPVDNNAFDSAVAACRTQLGETAFAAAWASAAARPFQEVVEEILKNWRIL